MATRKQKTMLPQKQAQEQYLESHAFSMDITELIKDKIGKIYDELFDTPAPDDEDRPINWHDVSCIREINGQLAQACTDLQKALEVFKKIK